ncbi:hypothetical protein MGG_12016 [Pyricularia oryzae 70-15]|uniref:Acetylxylan esterase n=2 Tax=Pyricularia oryzae TaxID=318829 RepID=G4NI03_PYRO7|nr:uncharacterized protein MGG_12016 [Pyricularia oryzae 70-15]EHA47863.1 hypothetical protein MGG_12016 [Pyricularia oryzae 70-15]ELQ41676.1 hypothetical protein OOU_Y34scaffold00258g10 [Pyricularia oryzae Y34]KAI7910528.1 hypothetical protein M9X92_011050 [Pyricularia oryzae]KAI7912699.1 hypothetical protein M0657_010357 [Pyricularia oryzae]
MHISRIALAALTALSTAAAQEAIACNEVQIFLSRGHGESMPGLQAVVADEICKGRPSCGFQSIAYNATSGAATLCVDQYAGVLRAWADVSEYAAQCPGSKLVISGWSRGGALVSDLLAGGGGIPLAGDLCEQPATPPLDPDVFPGNRVAAVLNFGVLHHNANQSWNVGSGSSRDGQHPRNEEMLRQLGRWADRFRDYCEANDPLCAQGGDPASHRDYFVKEKWRQMAAEFVASRLG